MRIPSYKKIEKQVEAYMKTWKHPDQEKINELNKELNRLARQWANIREKFCNGHPCICKTHPRFEEFERPISAINAELKQLYQKYLDAKKEKEKQLLRTLAAKIKYMKAN